MSRQEKLKIFKIAKEAETEKKNGDGIYKSDSVASAFDYGVVHGLKRVMGELGITQEYQEWSKRQDEKIIQ